MSGQDERNAKIKKSIENLLHRRPRYLYQFYTSLNDVLPMTQKNYLKLIVRFMENALPQWHINPWIVEEFANITPADIQQWIFEMDGQSSAKNTMFFALKKFFAFLEMNGYIPKNPMLKIKKPTSSKIKEAVSLTEEEIKILYANLKDPERTNDGTVAKKVMNLRQKFINRNLAMISIALTNGLRSASLIGIDLDDIDWENRTIRVVQKGDKYHIGYLSNNTMKYLEEWWDEREDLLAEKGIETDALFLGADGQRITYCQFEKIMEWATTGINKKITTHKLRSTCATNIYEATKDINLAARVLGHANINTTRRYIHVDEEKERQAISDLDKIFND